MSANAKGPSAGIRVEDFVPPPDGQSVRVEGGRRAVAVFRVGGKLFAIDAKCPHAGGPLERGTLTATSVVCPWHGSEFDLESGVVQRGPARTGVRAFAARMEGSALVLEEREGRGG